MDEMIRELRDEIAGLRSQAGPGELRLFEHVGARVLAGLPTWRERGMTYTEIAKAIGVSDTALHHWRRRAGQLPEFASSSRFLPVEVKSSAPAFHAPAPVHATLSLSCPSGHRLEGLDLAQAIALVRALS